MWLKHAAQRRWVFGPPGSFDALTAAHAVLTLQKQWHSGGVTAALRPAGRMTDFASRSSSKRPNPKLCQPPAAHPNTPPGLPCIAREQGNERRRRPAPAAAAPTQSLEEQRKTYSRVGRQPLGRARLGRPVGDAHAEVLARPIRGPSASSKSTSRVSRHLLPQIVHRRLHEVQGLRW